MRYSEIRIERKNKRKGLVFALVFNASIVAALGLTIIPKSTDRPLLLKGAQQEIVMMDNVELKSASAKPQRKVAKQKAVNKSNTATKRKRRSFSSLAAKKTTSKVKQQKSEKTSDKVDVSEVKPKTKPLLPKVTSPSKDDKSSGTSGSKGTKHTGKTIQSGLSDGKLGSDRRIESRCDEFLSIAKSMNIDGDVVFQVAVNALGKVVKVKPITGLTTVDSGAIIKATADCVGAYRYTPKPGSSLEYGRVTISYKVR